MLSDGPKAGQEEVADGQVGVDAIGQVDFGSEISAAVNVVGHLRLPFPSQCKIDTG